MIMRLVMLAAALALSGCVSVLPEAAPAKPRLHIAAASVDALSGPALSWSLAVEEPRSTRDYDTVRIAVAAAPGRTEYLGGAEWADRAPKLFQTALIQTYEDAGRILGVGDRFAVPVADLVLQTDIRHMQLAVDGGTDRAEISVYARMTDGKGTVYAAKKFEASSSAGSSSADDVYMAFDRASDEIISAIVAWSYEAGETARAR
ncbi:MAG: ABC-type transport auxiliary lipoprotein family protein [Parvularculaceae bacterium]